MDIKELVYQLTKEIQQTVKPHLGKIASRHSLGKAVGGDTTFVIDELAEETVESFLRKSGDIAYYSEDKGLVIYGKPSYILIIDPIDGTRPAAAGLESCCVSVAATEYKPEPKVKDIFLGCVQEIKNDTIFIAEKGKGVKIGQNGQELAPILSDNVHLETLFWTIGFRGRPARILIEVLGDLVDISSVNGGLFDLGSASFSLTRMIIGQMDAYIDIGKRIIDQIPEMEEEFKRVGQGTVLNNNPYDVAAAVLIAQEAGCLITDGSGNSIDDFPILGSGLSFQFSLIGATNPTLHKKILAQIDKGIERLKNN